MAPTITPWGDRASGTPYEGYRRHRLTCGSKRQYVTRAEAQAALERWKGPVPPGLDVYQCTTCWLFHHGHGPQHG
jgi:hypothetical protein